MSDLWQSVISMQKVKMHIKYYIYKVLHCSPQVFNFSRTHHLHMQHSKRQCLLLLTFALSVLEPHVSTALGQQCHYGIIAQLSS